MVYVSFFSPLLLLLLFSFRFDVENSHSCNTKNCSSYFHTQVHALSGNFLYAYTLHVQKHTHTCKYIHGPAHTKYTLLVNVSWCQMTTNKKGIKIYLTKRKKRKLEDLFSFKVLITYKNFFNFVKICQTPPNVSYPYTIIPFFKIIYLNVIIAADALHILDNVLTYRVLSSISSNIKITEIFLPRCTISTESLLCSLV